MRHVLRFVRRFHESRQGAEGLEKLLIIAAIVLPLLGLLLFFRDEIQDWVQGNWDEVRTDADDFQVGN